MSASPCGSITLTVSRFDTAFPTGPAFGTMADVPWAAFAEMFTERREGMKDGPNFIPARFAVEPDGRVRRLKQNVLARTAVALDCETHKATGEIPPPFAGMAERIQATGWSGLLYTSHNHTDAAPRYRIVVPLSAEIAQHLPAVEVVAEMLSVSGVLDTGKIGAASLFYLPSCEVGQSAAHSVAQIIGHPIDAEWMATRGGAILEAREAIQAQQRAAAMEAAEQRRAARIAAGFDPTNSLIEQIRGRLDLAGELLRHGYSEHGRGRYLYPGSETGVAGVYLVTGGDGVQRAYSHHSADPLAPANLPSWSQSKAVDAVDLLAVLDHGGDLKLALRKLAARFGIGDQRPEAESKEDNRAVAALTGRLIRERRSGAEVREQVLAEAAQRNMPADRAESIIAWIAGRELDRRRATHAQRG